MSDMPKVLAVVVLAIVLLLLFFLIRSINQTNQNLKSCKMDVDTLAKANKDLVEKLDEQAKIKEVIRNDVCQIRDKLLQKPEYPSRSIPIVLARKEEAMTAGVQEISDGDAILAGRQ